MSYMHGLNQLWNQILHPDYSQLIAHNSEHHTILLSFVWSFFLFWGLKFVKMDYGVAWLALVALADISIIPICYTNVALVI